MAQEIRKKIQYDHYCSFVRWFFYDDIIMCMCTITEEDLLLRPITDAEMRQVMEPDAKIKHEVEPQPLGKITNKSLVDM